MSCKIALKAFGAIVAADLNNCRPIALNDSNLDDLDKFICEYEDK